MENTQAPFPDGMEMQCLSPIVEESTKHQHEPAFGAFGGECREELDEESAHEAKRSRPMHNCDICGTWYTERRTLLRHQRTPAHCKRAGLSCQSYTCSTCFKTFARRDLRLRHVQEIHGGKRRDGRLQPQPVQQRIVDIKMDIQTACDARVYNSLPISGSTEFLDHASFTATGHDSGNGLAMDCVLPAHESHESTAANIDASSLLLEGDLALNETTTLPKMADRLSIDASEQSLAVLKGGEDVPSHLDHDQVSITSTSSRLSFSLPFRSGLLSSFKAKRNPRPRNLPFVLPCPLCRKELGRTPEEVEEHMQRHLSSLKSREAVHRCHTCHVGFLFEADLSLHLKSSSQSHSVHCGFDFDHCESCGGHHPPDSSSLGGPDHVAFTHRIRHWEQLQLHEYRGYVERFARGEIPTNAPVYGASGAAFTRSDQSLFSLRSHWSSRSAPGLYMRRLRAVTLPLNRVASKLMLRRAPAISNPLIDAIKARNVDRVNSLLGEDTSISDEIIDVAARNPSAPVLRLLLDHTSVDRRQLNAEKALRVAIDTGDVESMEALLAAWKTPNTDRDYPFSASLLKNAVGLGDIAVVRTILAAGADVNVDESYYLLTQAASLADPAMCELLLVSGARVQHWFSRMDSGPLAIALRARNYETSRVLLQAGARFESTEYIGDIFRDNDEQLLYDLVLGFDPFKLEVAHRAACEGWIHALTRLFSSGLDVDIPDDHQRTPLHSAVLCNALQCVELLLEHGANVNATDSKRNTPLHYAVFSGSIQVTQALLGRGATVDPINSLGYTPLRRVDLGLSVDALRIAKLLVQTGANIHSCNNLSQTLLHEAAAIGATEIVKALMDWGAHVNAQDHKGQTPLHFAAESSLETVRLLLKSGADVDAQDLKGQTPLHRAAGTAAAGGADRVSQAGWLEIVGVLLTWGADLHAQACEGQTPLHIVATTGSVRSIAVFEFLLHRGADMFCLDHYQMSPSSLASEHFPQTMESIRRDFGTGSKTSEHSRKAYFGGEVSQTSGFGRKIDEL